MLGIIPQETERIRQMMEDLGLNPDDDREDYSSPIGIGNLCGNNVVKDRLDDGINQVSCHQRKPYIFFLTLKNSISVGRRKQSLQSTALHGLHRLPTCQYCLRSKSPFQKKSTKDSGEKIPSASPFIDFLFS